MVVVDIGCMDQAAAMFDSSCPALCRVALRRVGKGGPYLNAFARCEFRRAHAVGPRRGCRLPIRERAGTAEPAPCVKQSLRGRLCPPYRSGREPELPILRRRAARHLVLHCCSDLDQPEVACHRTKIAIVVEKRPVVFDALGADQQVDGLADRDASPAQRAEVAGRGNCDRFAGHWHDVEMARRVSTSAAAGSLSRPCNISQSIRSPTMISSLPRSASNRRAWSELRSLRKSIQTLLSTTITGCCGPCGLRRGCHASGICRAPHRLPSAGAI